MIVREAGLGKAFVCRMDFESDFLTSLEEFAKEHEIEAAFFVALGAVKKASFAYYEQASKKYVEEVVDEPMELLSCVGNFGMLGGNVVVHAHAVFSDRSGKLLGGHLIKGTTVFAGEVLIFELGGVSLVRAYDNLTGLNLYTPNPKD
ncbi:MAG: PPC domain-containing DNA-binding protein [Nitrososphaerales archaeon]